MAIISVVCGLVVFLLSVLRAIVVDDFETRLLQAGLALFSISSASWAWQYHLLKTSAFG